MRPIKFRSYSNDTKTMYPYAIQGFNGELWVHKNQSHNGEWKNIGCGNDEEIVDYSYELMQFTGLTDKHGVEIYENDIIREYSDTASGFGPDNLVYEIRYHGDGFYFFNPVLNTIISNWKLRNHCKFYEVIGNVYQNPEILTIK